MKIEDILNKLIKSYDNNKKLKDEYNEIEWNRNDLLNILEGGNNE